jgi:hypothetical protein
LCDIAFQQEQIHFTGFALFIFMVYAKKLELIQVARFGKICQGLREGSFLRYHYRISFLSEKWMPARYHIPLAQIFIIDSLIVKINESKFESLTLPMVPVICLLNLYGRMVNIFFRGET